jgi:uncharacterized membrane protein
MILFRKRPTFDELYAKDCAVVIAPVENLDILGLYRIFRDYLQHEDNLINSRLTWSLTVHGFLFACYGILLGKLADDFAALQASAHSQLQEHIIVALFCFQLPIALLGVFVGFSSWRAIKASHYAIQHLVAIAHHEGQPLKIDTCVATVPDKAMLLPRIIAGGAKIERRDRKGEKRGSTRDRGASDQTASARFYYLNLPALITGVWMLLLLASITLAYCSGRHRLDFFQWIAS